MTRHLRLISMICVLALLAIPATAQDDLPPYAASLTGESGAWDLLSGTTLNEGEFTFGLYFNNVDRVFEFDDQSDADISSLRLSLGYGFTDRFEMSLMLPYVDIDPDFGPLFDPVGGEPFGSGLGNARLGGKFQLTEEDIDRGLALNVFIDLPTGDEDVLGGETGFGAGLDWSLGRWLVNVGYEAPGDVDNFDVSDQLKAGLGYVSTVSDNLQWITEVVATVPTDSDEAIFEESVDLTTGGRLWLGDERDWAFNFALRTDLLQLSDTDDHCPLGGLLGLTYLTDAGFFGRGGRNNLVDDTPPPPPVIEPDEYTLTVRTQGNCDGVVTSTPGGIDCGVNCSEDYDDGTVVTLRARPQGANCEFQGFSGDADCNDGSVTMNSDKNCIATFNEVVPPPPPPPEEQRVEVNFNSGSARLSNIAKAKLDEVALRMRQEPSSTALVIGYSDNRGSDTANRRASEQRAQAVKDYLVNRQGVDASRITVEGRGSADPIASNDTAAGRAQNRRAVVILRIE